MCLLGIWPPPWPPQYSKPWPPQYSKPSYAYEQLCHFYFCIPFQSESTKFDWPCLRTDQSLVLNFDARLQRHRLNFRKSLTEFVILVGLFENCHYYSFTSAVKACNMFRNPRKLNELRYINPVRSSTRSAHHNICHINKIWLEIKTYPVLTKLAQYSIISSDNLRSSCKKRSAASDILIL